MNDESIHVACRGRVVTITLTCRSARKAEYTADGINEDLIYNGKTTLTLTKRQTVPLPPLPSLSEDTL